MLAPSPFNGPNLLKADKTQKGFARRFVAAFFIISAREQIWPSRAFGKYLPKKQLPNLISEGGGKGN
jgi:hypothetical protein